MVIWQTSLPHTSSVNIGRTPRVVQYLLRATYMLSIFHQFSPVLGPIYEIGVNPLSRYITMSPASGPQVRFEVYLRYILGLFSS